MPDNTLKAIKPWVKAFSEEIPRRYKHGDVVCVGGMITSILDIASIMESENEFVHINIDDDVGSMTLLVPQSIYAGIVEEHELKQDMIVLAEGKVYDADKGKNDMKNKESSIFVICWNVYPLPDTTEKEH